ncbi:MAG: LysR family transcriptional regulator [Rhodospirillaceae bacterium]|jgi:DNA-binding transcriptional LysR family regulator|nr:LysR family transcriptional regulator [Rhodospirillaceae bacterium]
MNEINLRNIDLNLLTIFQAIYSDGQVVKAAATLGLTQPAVSHALGRLRNLFNDPLFVRSRSGMDPTPRAHEISDQVSQILINIRQVVSGDSQFDPATSKRELKIGMLDYGMTHYAPEIAKILSKEAPYVVMNCQQIRIESAIELMDRDGLDFALAPFGTLPERIQRKVLMREEYYVVARRNHPKLKNGLSVETYAALKHVYISSTSEIMDRVDHEFQNVGVTRKIGMSVPHYSAAMFAVAKSDFIAIIPKGPAELYQKFCDLDLYEPPIKLMPRVISVIHHQRRLNDPLIEWLWDKFDIFVRV